LEQREQQRIQEELEAENRKNREAETEIAELDAQIQTLRQKLEAGLQQAASRSGI
jgi:hypothetical protein